MAQRVDVCNIALSWLGADDITSIDDASEEAKQCKIHYDSSRDATLEAYPWSFAVRRFIPAKSAAEPEYEYANKFAIPSDILHITRVDDRNVVGAEKTNYASHREQATYSVESGFILTNADTIWCTGIRRIDDEGIYSPLFVQAFAARLAMDMAQTLAQSQTVEQHAAGRYVGFLQRASAKDGQQGRSRRLRNRSFRNARSSGVGVW